MPDIEESTLKVTFYGADVKGFGLRIEVMFRFVRTREAHFGFYSGRRRANIVANRIGGLGDGPYVVNHRIIPPRANITPTQTPTVVMNIQTNRLCWRERTYFRYRSLAAYVRLI